VDEGSVEECLNWSVDGGLEDIAERGLMRIRDRKGWAGGRERGAGDLLEHIEVVLASIAAELYTRCG